MREFVIHLAHTAATFLVILLMTAVVVAAGWLLGGCSMDVDHRVRIGVAVDDECLTCFPECTPSGPECVDTDGARCAGCNVSCIAARELTCDGTDIPRCLQVAGDEDIDVPVVCLGDAR